MLRETFRRIFWISEEWWWADPLFVAIVTGFLIIFGGSGRWYLAVGIAVAVLVIREILYHLLVRRKRRNE